MPEKKARVIDLEEDCVLGLWAENALFKPRQRWIEVAGDDLRETR